MLATVRSGAVFGVEGYTVNVEVDLRKTVEPRFQMVGLPEASVRESQVRVRAALRNSGIELPPAVIALNLAPADRPKRGTLFDLPMALGLAATLGKVPAEALARVVVVGELALDGRLRGVPGVLPLALQARRAGAAAVMVPRDNAPEALAVSDLVVAAPRSLEEAIAWLHGEKLDPVPPARPAPAIPCPDFNEVRGQQQARRAAEIAAAGSHNLLMVGPPGCGKSLISRRIPGILPAPTQPEQLDITRIWSVAGLLRAGDPLMERRPFRAPHHTLSVAAMVGGGAIPVPGEVSLAHNGVLFLDELPEFRRGVLESLRQPLEDGEVSIVRAMRRADFPSRLMLVAAMNPCPCGWLGSPLRSCRCTSFQVLSYRSRVSGPLLDRIDLHVELNPVEYRDLRGNGSGDSSAAIRLRVERARAKQLERQSSSAGPVWNSDLGCAGLRDHARLDEAGHALLELAATRLSLSARSIASVRRVARTIADLVGQRRIEAEHVAEALQYRRIGKEEQDAAAQPRPSKRRSGGSRAQQPNPCQDQP